MAISIGLIHSSCILKWLQEQSLQRVEGPQLLLENDSREDLGDSQLCLTQCSSLHNKLTSFNLRFQFKCDLGQISDHAIVDHRGEGALVLLI